MRQSCLWFLLLLAMLPLEAVGETRDLLIIAGQSNAVGFDAKPESLAPSEADRQIMFWWRCGDPPPDQHDSTSGGKWLHLQTQPLGEPDTSGAPRQYGNFAQDKGGFGPEIGMARTLFANGHPRLAVVKAAFSGTGMKQDWNPHDAGPGGSCYRSLVAEIREATAAAKKQGVDLRPMAFAWIQGESDARPELASNYANALDEMLTSLRSDLKTPDLPAFIAVNTRYGGGKNKHVPVVVAQQQLLARADPRCVYVDTSSATIANAAHYDGPGTLAVGNMFAEALLRWKAERGTSKRHLRIVTLGDSITKGVRSGVTDKQTFAALLEKQLSDPTTEVKVANVGVGGERTDQALKRLETIVQSSPHVVTVMYGTNDSYVDQGKSTSRITVEMYRENLSQIVARLSQASIQPVLMTPPRWSSKAKANGLDENPNLKLQPYVEACRSVAAEWRVPLVDHHRVWLAAEQEGRDLHQWTTDGCHPNPAGHAELAKSIVPMIQETLSSSQPPQAARGKLLSGKPIKVVCFGDSVTGVYYHTGSRRAYTDMLGIGLTRIAGVPPEMINAGISGHTTVNALQRIDEDVLRHKPDVVTVMFGLNDMTRVSLKDYRANLLTIVRKCREVGAEVILATPNNVSDTEARPTAKLTKYCDVVRDVAKQTKSTLYDCYRQLEGVRQVDAESWQGLMSDPIHPNMNGHKRMAEGLCRSIAGLRCELENVPPGPQTHLQSRLMNREPIRIVAMPPFDEHAPAAIQRKWPGAKVEVTPWPIDTKLVSDVEKTAQAKIRGAKPDLVVIALPRSVTANDRESFRKSFEWVINWSLNFGPPTWDVWVVHPAVNDPNTSDRLDDDLTRYDDLIRELVRAHDLKIIDRTAQDQRTIAEILDAWLE